MAIPPWTYPEVSGVPTDMNSRPAAFATVLAGILIALGVSGLEPCDSDEDTAAQTGAEVSKRPPEWDIKTSCPEEIRIRDRPTCKLIAGRVKLTDCHHPRVGHDVRVSGISCREALGLQLPLGHSTFFGKYKESRQALYRPAVATYSRPLKIRNTGWTCWGDFDHDRAYAIQYVCWRGRDVLTFRFD